MKEVGKIANPGPPEVQYLQGGIYENTYSLIKKGLSQNRPIFEPGKWLKYPEQKGTVLVGVAKCQ